MKQFIRKNKHNSTTKEFRFKSSGKRHLWKIQTFCSYGFQQKNMNSKKKKELRLVRAQGCAKKVWVPKQIEFPQKKKSYFLGPNIVPKKVWVPKKYEFQKKTNSYVFSGRTLCQKKCGFQKKRNSYFFRAENCAKKMGSKKKCLFKKKELKLKFSFFEPNIVPEKNMTAQKRMRSEKKKELILFRAKHCAKKRNSYFWRYFFAGIFFLFDLKISSNKNKSTGKICFSTYFLFCLNWFSVQTKKKYRQKGTQKYEFLFFLELIFFLEPIFFRHNVRPKKNMSSFFFFGIHTFFGTMFGPKKIWVPFSLELIIFFLALCLAPKNMNSFFGGTQFVLKPIFSFWHNIWPEKVWIPFFLKPILSWHTLGPEKLWVPFFLELIPRKSMSSFFFWNSYFFLALIFFWHNVWPEKVWVVFFWN